MPNEQGERESSALWVKNGLRCPALGSRVKYGGPVRLPYRLVEVAGSWAGATCPASRVTRGEWNQERLS